MIVAVSTPTKPHKQSSDALLINEKIDPVEPSKTAVTKTKCSGLKKKKALNGIIIKGKHLKIVNNISIDPAAATPLKFK